MAGVFAFDFERPEGGDAVPRSVWANLRRYMRWWMQPIDFPGKTY